MRVACLFDIHGNFPALEAVMAEVQESRIDRLLIGGDVLPGPMPRECLDLLRRISIPVNFLIGNGDRETMAARRGTMSAMIPPAFHDAMRWNGAQLTDDDQRVIDGWPLTARMRIAGIGEVVFCHATPRNDTEIFLRSTAEEKLLPIVEPLGAQLIVCGHTHMQFDRMVGRTRIINAGSVGMPFQPAGAYWLLLGRTIELRRTSYDFESAAAAVRATDYPQAEQYAVGILTPPDENTTLEQFRAAEL